MEKVGRRTSARQRRGNLAADNPGLAHSGHDHAAAALEEQLHGPLEVAVDPVHQAEDRLRFGPKDLARQLERCAGRLLHATAPRAMSWILTSRRSSASSESSRSAFWASLFARAGSS